MMSIKEMVELGFTDDQIKVLINQGEEKKQEETQEKEKEKKQEETPKEDVKKGESKEFDQEQFTNMFEEMLNRMNASVDEFTKKVQETNINNAQMPAEKSTDDIFSEIILPKEE